MAVTRSCNELDNRWINANEMLVAVYNKWGRALPMYDDYSGGLWLYEEANGFSGVVRASSWEEAHEIVVDEIMLDADEDAKDEDEGIYVRGGTPTNPELKSLWAQSDLNGYRITPLVYQTAVEREILVVIAHESNDADDVLRVCARHAADIRERRDDHFIPYIEYGASAFE